MPAKKRQDWIWDKIIYANPIKPHETLIELDKYRPLVTYDNFEEIKKMKKHSPHAGLCLRIRVSNTGAVVELSSKFGASAGEAVDLILEAARQGLGVEGISFHVGSQTTNFENYVQAINLSAEIFAEAKARGYGKMNVLDIGGGFPAPYDATVKPFEELAAKINSELNRLFPDPKMEILAEPGRFMIATAGTSVVRINGKAVRDGKTCYYVNDGAYHTYSGIIFDHQHVKMYPFRNTKYPENCSVFGPTCDALDVISHSMPLPTDLQLGELLYAPNMGAYAHSSSTWFNGFPPAKVIHVNYRK
ncbi:MAG: type III PLP-dependent enzyme, partial [Elusimicrobiales bacterium]